MRDIPEEIARLKNTHLMDWLREGYDHCQRGSKDWCQGYLDSARLYIEALEDGWNTRTPLPPAVTESELVEALRPHVEKIANCIRINDEMGCVVIGQTDAARALKEIFDRFANIGKD